MFFEISDENSFVFFVLSTTRYDLLTKDRRGLIRSIGSGNIIVEFFSAAILFKV
jgi:hypothetical protein